ncbi:MAG TPA: hypothetical protein VE035_14790, partial [Puia sp.]|nr:hypothetical protein [Puia sp.]
MKKSIGISGAAILLSFLVPFGAMAQSAHNTLTSVEKHDGWRLLFDGKTSSGWVSAHADTFPSKP